MLGWLLDMGENDNPPTMELVREGLRRRFVVVDATGTRAGNLDVVGPALALFRGADNSEARDILGRCLERAFGVRCDYVDPAPREAPDVIGCKRIWKVVQHV